VRPLWADRRRICPTQRRRLRRSAGGSRPATGRRFPAGRRRTWGRRPGSPSVERGGEEG